MSAETDQMTAYAAGSIGLPQVRGFLFGIGCGIVIGSWLAFSSQGSLPQAPPERPVKRKKDIVDIASEDSFPASDAPAF